MAPRRAWVLPLRVVASVVMLAFLLRRVHIGSALPDWDVRTAIWLGAALLVTLAGIFVSTLRWRTVLSALGLEAKVLTLFSFYLAGQFVGNFLPSTIGGDVLRVSRLSSVTGDRADGFASVVLERMTGWLVLPLITLAAFLINPSLRHLGRATALATALAVATLALLAAILTAAAHPSLGGRIAGNAGWRRFIGAVHHGLDVLRRRPGDAAMVLLVGLAYQLTVVAAAYCAARALELDLGPTALLAFFPAVAIAQVLPFSVGGLGLREGALILFLKPLGIGTSEAFGLGVLVYALNLTVSLLGAPAFAVGNRAARPPVLT